MNVNFGLFPPIEAPKAEGKRLRGKDKTIAKKRRHDGARAGRLPRLARRLPARGAKLRSSSSSPAAARRALNHQPSALPPTSASVAGIAVNGEPSSRPPHLIAQSR